LDEVTAKRIPKCDHDEELRLPICDLRFVIRRSRRSMRGAT
jgi:hypothetical protein